MNRLAAYIEQEGISQVEFARRAGLDQPLVSMIATGKRRPGLDSAMAIEKATGGAVPASCWCDTDAANDSGRRPAKRASKG